MVPLPVRLPAGEPLRGLVPSTRSLAAGLALAALALAAYATARLTPVFAVRTVEVHGAPPALAADVRGALSPLVGSNLVALRRDDVERRVAALPEVGALTYDRAFPNTLVVTVRVEQPVAVVRRGAESWLVSDRGRILRAIGRGTRPLLPRIWLPRTVPVARGRALPDEHALRAARVLAPLVAEPLPRRVTTVRVADDELTLLTRVGLEVRLGDASDLTLKLAVARRVLPLLASPADGGPTYLDVSIPARPVAGPKSKVGD